MKNKQQKIIKKTSAESINTLEANGIEQNERNENIET